MKKEWKWEVKKDVTGITALCAVLTFALSVLGLKIYLIYLVFSALIKYIS